MFGVVAAGVGTLEDLESGGIERLAHLLRDEGGEVIDLVFEDGCELAHPQGPVLERHDRVGAKRVGGEGDLLARDFVGKGIEAAQQLAGGGIDRLDGHAECGVTLTLV